MQKTTTDSSIKIMKRADRLIFIHRVKKYTRRAVLVLAACIIGLCYFTTDTKAATVEANASVVIEQIPVAQVTQPVQPAQMPEIVVQQAMLMQPANNTLYWYDGIQHFQLTDNDKQILAKLVMAEAGCEEYVGKVAVAAVVLNRYACTDSYANFDNRSIEHVIKQPGQFTSIAGVKPTAECYLAVEDAVNGVDPTVTPAFPNGAYYFYNPAGTSKANLASRKDITSITIGRHVFHSWFRKDEAAMTGQLAL